MVTVIKTAQDLINAEDKYFQNGRVFDKSLVLDTRVIHDKNTGQDDLAFDLKEFLSVPDRGDFLWYVLENTMKSFKNKKEKALFVNTVMRKVGKDMRVSGDSVTLYGKRISNNNTFIWGIVRGSDNEELLDSDSELVWKILGGKTYDTPLKLKGGQRFDADNPLHQKLAEIAQEWEADGAKKFDGFTKRWLHDTQPTRYMENANEKRKNIDEDDLISGMRDMPVEKLYGEYRKKEYRLTDSQKVDVVTQLIKRAPVDMNWCLTIGRMLPGFKEQKYKSRGKATLLQDEYKVIQDFSKKYDSFLNQTMDKLGDLQEKYEDADKNLQDKNREIKRHQQHKRALNNRQKRWYEFYRKVDNVIVGFRQDVLYKAESKKEQDFYENLYNSLDKYLSYFTKTGDSKKLKSLAIQGKPWGMLGGNRDQKARFETANKIIAEYNEMIKKLPKKYTDNDYEKGEELSVRYFDLQHEQNDAERTVEDVRRELQTIQRFIQDFSRVNKDMVEFKDKRVAVYESAKKKLANKMKETPAVKSGYHEFNRGASQREKAAVDAEKKQKQEAVVAQEQAKARVRAAKLRDVTEKLRKDNKRGKLSEAEIAALAEKMLAKGE